MPADTGGALVVVGGVEVGGVVVVGVVLGVVRGMVEVPPLACWAAAVVPTGLVVLPQAAMNSPKLVKIPRASRGIRRVPPCIDANGSPSA